MAYVKNLTFVCKRLLYKKGHKRHIEHALLVLTSFIIITVYYKGSISYSLWPFALVFILATAHSPIYR